MWLCMNDGFLSIVDDGTKPGYLLVRARDKNTLPNVFGKDVQVTIDHSRDYLYRAYIDRDLVAGVIAYRIMNDIRYPNFKDSVKDKRLARAYGDMWETMFQYQADKEYGNYRS